MWIIDAIKSVLSKEPEETAEDWEQREKNHPTQTHQDTELVVTGTMKISGVGTVVTARITDGMLRKGDRLSFEDGTTAEVETIELHHNEVEKAEEGNVVGLELSGIDASYIAEGTRATAEGGTEEDG